MCSTSEFNRRKTVSSREMTMFKLNEDDRFFVRVLADARVMGSVRIRVEVLHGLSSAKFSLVTD